MGEALVREVKKKILVIDDESPIAEMIAEFCVSFGYEAKVTTTSENVLQTVKDYQPDLITLDLLMPEISGLEVMEELREDQITRNIPIIIISSLAGTPVADQIERSELVLSKPIRMSHLEGVLSEVLA